MKKQMFFWLLLLSTVATQAQLRKIPAEVTDAFKTRYPHAEKVSWKDKISSFGAEFILNGVEMSADFSSKGEWEKTEKNLKFENLPGEVVDGFAKSKYSDWEKGSIVEIDENSQSLVYRIFVKKSAVSKKYLYFDAKGKLQKESISL
ncbi:MAG TPA: PepSY-like domain-containing protein [Panacibacter sp.]|nr:PepSY-like domain-containing protein [Panacibacter sp.]HNP42672.1 PepSY-like domain-containing protein [Panacibacter sp.]